MLFRVLQVCTKGCRGFALVVGGAAVVGPNHARPRRLGFIGTDCIRVFNLLIDQQHCKSTQGFANSASQFKACEHVAGLPFKQIVPRAGSASKRWYSGTNLAGTGGTVAGRTRGATTEKVSQRISEGEPLSTALAESKLTTEISFQMLTVGERTGSVGDMLTKTAQFLEADTSKAVEAFSRIFEPLLMALIGLIIGVVVVLMYMPIFELANSLQ